MARSWWGRSWWDAKEAFGMVGEGPRGRSMDSVVRLFQITKRDAALVARYAQKRGWVWRGAVKTASGEYVVVEDPERGMVFVDVQYCDIVCGDFSLWKDSCNRRAARRSSWSEIVARMGMNPDVTVGTFDRIVIGCGRANIDGERPIRRVRYFEDAQVVHEVV